MIGSEYNWLLRLSRTSGGATIRLVGSSVFTLLIVISCVLGTALMPAGPTRTAGEISPPSLQVSGAPVVSDWPRNLVLFWFILPHLVSHDN